MHDHSLSGGSVDAPERCRADNCLNFCVAVRHGVSYPSKYIAARKSSVSQATGLKKGETQMFRIPKRSRLNLSILAVFFLLSAGNVLAQSRPFIPLHTVNSSSSEYTRFKSWVDQAVAGNPGWGFSATEAAIMYRLTGQVAYANLAISMVESDVQAAEAAIAAGNRPRIAADSYLEVGDYIQDLAIVYDWIYDRLTASQRTRWASYAEQAVWNVWNHT